MHINVLLRGGGGFDPSLKKLSLCPPMYCSEGVAVLIPHEDKLKLRSCSICWPEGWHFGSLKIHRTIPTNVLLREGVADLLPHEDRLKLRSYSIYWPEGVAVLISYCKRFRLLLCLPIYCSSNIMAWRGGSFDAFKFNGPWPRMHCPEGIQ